MKTPWTRAIFWIGGFYDLVLGLAFLFAGPRIFAAAGVEPPNHWAYLHFPALLLLVFGALFLQIALDPARNGNLIPYGMGLKVAYCITVFGHYFTGGLPGLWVPLACIDLVFLVCFAVAWDRQRRGAPC